MKLLRALLTFAAAAVAVTVDDCPGYRIVSQKKTSSSLTASLTLNGRPCNVYGDDLKNLDLHVTFETADRLHILIQDPQNDVYQVPDTVFPRPQQSQHIDASLSNLDIVLTANPFAFAVTRKSTGETLFNTSSVQLIFESQYLRLRTTLPDNPNLYGLGEHADPLRLPTRDYTRTFWNRDAPGTRAGENLYGHHNIYFEHRSTGTHGVFFLNSNGADVKINKGASQYLEYNLLGGVVDLYFFNGPKPSDVSRQYAQLAKTPALQPYWAFGLHQCRYGYQDAYNVAEVIANYSKAGIPLETMWTDIDYMDRRRVFSLDPDRFPLQRVREVVEYLHQHQQKYVVMVDPAVWAGPVSGGPTAGPYQRGLQQKVFLHHNDGSPYFGVVWPGLTAFPDWFASGTQEYWNSEFARFFNPKSGVDIDALWIDMNEPSNFCDFPCNDPEEYAMQSGNPPEPPPVRKNAPRAIPGFPPDFQPHKTSPNIQERLAQLASVFDMSVTDSYEKQINDDAAVSIEKRLSGPRAIAGKALGLPGRDLIMPKYQINNFWGVLSNKTTNTDLIHANGIAEYDAHDLYGTMMGTASRTAMLARRPSRRPLVITRSTFAGAGKHVGHWLGDNLSTWWHYRISIAQIISFAAFYQVPMVGADVCGFGDNTTETLCARWALLGAFYPFFRNHNNYGERSQEFYVWPLTTAAAKHALDYRLRLLDYLYTAFWRQNQDGTPTINPLFFLHAEDENTWGIDEQFYFGERLLVSPVTEENSTSVEFYLPDETFYDFFTGEAVRGHGATVTRHNVQYTEIPVHIRGGSIIPLRSRSTNTTVELRKQNFTVVVAPDNRGQADGELYLDDGESVEIRSWKHVKFVYANGKIKFEINGTYDAGVYVEKVRILGSENPTARLPQTRDINVNAKIEPLDLDVSGSG